MSQVIFGYLIDPQLATIRRVEIPRSNVLKTLYQHIGAELVERVALDEIHDAWVDENGWLSPARAALEVHTMKGQLFAGRAVILAHDAEGESVSPQFSMEYFCEQIDAIQPVMSAEFETFRNKLPDGTPVFGERLKQVTTHAVRATLSVAK
ncbi:DUF3846 domain-containing protein [Sinorhizobium fredii]|uniref:DUF3846 domain-containing protein n=1 Tax=Rhizobium fredii TaxID=380 RepID=UPI003510E977